MTRIHGMLPSTRWGLISHIWGNKYNYHFYASKFHYIMSEVSKT